MKTRSAKAKGKRLQKYVVNLFKQHFNLTDDEVRDVASSVNGEDIIFNSEQKERFGISIECKNTEKLNIWQAIEQATRNSNGKQPVVFFKRNRSDVFVVINSEYFMELLKKYV